MPSTTYRRRGLRRVHKSRKIHRGSPRRNKTSALRIRIPANKKGNQNTNWGRTPVSFKPNNAAIYNASWLEDMLYDSQDYDTKMYYLMLDARPFIEDWLFKYEQTRGQIPNYLVPGDLPSVQDPDDRDLISSILFALSNLNQQEYEYIAERYFPNALPARTPRSTYHN